MRAAFVIAGAVLLVACGSHDPPAASASSAVVPAVANIAPASSARYDGYGDVRFGMDEAAFAEAWRGELKGAPSPGSSCFHKTPKGVTPPADVAFMFEGGRFVRYDVGTVKETAPGGGKVGMDEARIRALYAHVDAQPHKYVSGASYLRIAAPHGDEVLVFETDAQGKITRWRVGVPPQIDYVEGCG
ncbi:MAG TPA: lectin [Rhodanobacter sp.]|nr:lectin [Rhodanobacter sp.]